VPKPLQNALLSELRAALPGVAVAAPERRHLEDATRVRGLRGRADAVALPRDVSEVLATVSWCYEHDVAIIPRGGGTGYAGGAVPIDGGVVLGLDRLRAIRSFDPALWRMHVESGLRTSEVHRLARENGLMFGPDPGAMEESQIGGNVATNAGGPHTFKYGVTGRWVTGIEAVIPPGEILRVGGAISKDQAGYDLRSLLIGSEGTLGVITAVWLRLRPAPEAAHPVLAVCDSRSSGCQLVQHVFANGIVPAALEFLDGSALEVAARALPAGPVGDARFLVLAEADGSRDEAARERDELVETMSEFSSQVVAPRTAGERRALWSWREGVSLTVAAHLGGKVGEDIVVPLDSLEEALEAVEVIAARHHLATATWGHAGDGNIHANFLIDPDDAGDLARAEAAACDLFELSVDLRGSISGEHGVGRLKRAFLPAQLGHRGMELQGEIKAAFDPKGLMNPGKKV
jgi:glycolate oxidase subunit GlcD